MPVAKKKRKTTKNDVLDKSKTMGTKTKLEKKGATDKVVNLESAKIMARQVIAAMQSNTATEKSTGETNSIMIIQDDEPLPISPPNPTSGEPTKKDQEEVTIPSPSPLQPSKLPTSSLSQTSNASSWSTPYSSSNPMAEYPPTYTTPQQCQQDFTSNNDPTPIRTTPVNRIGSARQLNFKADKTDSMGGELSSEMNNAICLSYDCDQ